MIRGVVMCGGKSKRMGSDKGMLRTGPYSWAKNAALKLQALDLPVCISINKTQLKTYLQEFPTEYLIADQVNAMGPLTGLLSVHLKFSRNDLLALACDMTEMDIETLRYLKNSIHTFPGFDYYVYTQEDFIEPLCALYTAAALKKIYTEVQNDKLAHFSLRKLIEQGNYKSLNINNTKAFHNQNFLNYIR